MQENNIWVSLHATIYGIRRLAEGHLGSLTGTAVRPACFGAGEMWEDGVTLCCVPAAGGSVLQYLTLPTSLITHRRGHKLPSLTHTHTHTHTHSAAANTQCAHSVKTHCQSRRLPSNQISVLECAHTALWNYPAALGDGGSS